jgi:hypothetical protein
MQEQQSMNELIKNNPLERFEEMFNVKLLNDIVENFTSDGEKCFINKFYMYLNYENKPDFVIDLNDVWELLGVNQKVSIVRLLEKSFKLNDDYTKEKILCNKENAKKWGGANKHNFFLTTCCFKHLCLKIKTPQSYEIYEFYTKMTGFMHELVYEQLDYLKIRLCEINKINKKNESMEKARLNEKELLSKFPLTDCECIYFGIIDNPEHREKIITFGETYNIASFHADHQRNFVLVAIFKIYNWFEIIPLIKEHPEIKHQLRSIEISGKINNNILAYDAENEGEFTIEKLNTLISDIFHTKIYSVENYNRLVRENEFERAIKEDLIIKNHKMQQQLTNLTLEIEKLKECLEKQKTTLVAVEKEAQSVYHNEIIPEDEMTTNFNEFISTMCVVRPDVEEASGNMEGQLRIWLKTKPTKEIFHAFKHYLDVRFKHARLSDQNKEHVVHGYIGVKLIPIVYEKKFINDDAETFLFQVCKFTPSGKMLNSTLLDEYRKWKGCLGKPILETDMKELKNYLNSCVYVIKATVWATEGANEGYYGVELREQIYKPNYTGSTGKEVEKVVKETGIVLVSWCSIAKAALSEGISAPKMSRSIKSGIVFNDYFYRIKT